MKEDVGKEPYLDPVETVAFLQDKGFLETDGKPDFKCWDYCQRLLFSGWAKRFVLGPLEAFPAGKAKGQRLVRHEMVPLSAGCDNTLLYPTYATDEDVKGPRPPPYLWDKLDDFLKQGMCFRSQSTTDNRADVYFVSNANFDPERTDPKVFDPRLLPIEPFSRRTIYRNRDGRLVRLMQRTRLRYSRLAVPLQITPPFNFATSRAGHWTYSDEHQLGEDPPAGMMRQWLSNDLRIRGLAGDTITVTARKRRS
jgi:hypothetical protein